MGLFFPIQIRGLLLWSALALTLDSQPVFGVSSLHHDNQHWLSHGRAPELCAHTFNGLEGTPIKGFTLDRAFVVTTPGLVFHQKIDSLLNKGGHSSTHCHFHKYAKSHPSEKIKSFSEVLWLKQSTRMKSMQGSDFKLFNHVPTSFRCKDGMLTPQGIAQAVRLGEYLAKSYFSTIGSLAPSVSSTKDLAYSAGDEYLYQNAHSVLFGLLTEKQFVHANVGKLSRHFTDDSKSQIENQDHLSQYVRGSFMNEHSLFKDNSSPTADRWWIDSEFGKDISAKDILSSLSLKECQKPAKNAAHISRDLMQTVLSLSDAHNSYLSNSSIFYNYSKSISLPFRKFLNTWISSLLKDDNDFKLVSVDELFMLSLLTFFRGDDITHIPPVSRLAIERFHFQSKQQNLQQPETALRSDLIPLSSSSSSPPTPIVLQLPNHPNQLKEGSIGKSKPATKTLDPREVYFRVLYNGNVITHDILKCRSDPLVSLGLCGMPKFVTALMRDELAQFRDEL